MDINNTLVVSALKLLMECDRIMVSEQRWLESILDNPAKWTFADMRKLESLYCQHLGTKTRSPGGFPTR